MTAVLAFALGIFIALSITLANRWRFEADRANREADRADAMTAECVRLARIARNELDAHEQLKAEVIAERLVRVPTDEQLEAGVWQ